MRLSHIQRKMNIQNNIQLKEYNSFRTKAIAKLYCEPKSAEELSEITKLFRQERKLVLGAGYNLFFTKDFDGLVIKPFMSGMHLIHEDEQGVELEVGAAEDWDRLVGWTVDRGYAGLENLSLIPGSVGASPIQNIGAYGKEVKECITLVNTVDIETGEIVSFTTEQCRFAYRDSYFKQTRKHIVTSVRFRLLKDFTYHERYADLNKELNGIANPTLKQVREAIIRIRNRKLPDPEMFPNAGSFFKNPLLTADEKNALQLRLPELPIYPVQDNLYKTSAAYLIEKAGLKGKRKGQVGVYENHALIIVNYGTESGAEIAAFVKEIQEEVLKQFAVKLEPEVWIF